MIAIGGQLWSRTKTLAPSAGPRERVGSRAALSFGLYIVAYYFGYRFGMSFGEQCASPFWFPDSILLCALLLSPRRWWWLFVLGALPIRLFVAVPADVPTWFLL